MTPDKTPKGCGENIITPDMTSSCGDISFSNEILLCPSCKEQKTPLEKYSKDNPERAKERAKNRYYEKKEEILEKNKEYRKTNPDKMKVHYKKYRDNPENKDKINLRARHYQSGFRDEIILEKGECEDCGSKNKLQLHHEDYNEDSKVEVLCEKCHKKRHRKYSETSSKGNKNG